MERLFRLGCMFLTLVSQSLSASALKMDEQVIYFPTTGSWNDESGTWQISIHGWVFEAELDSFWRHGAMTVLKQQLGLSPHSNDSQNLKKRGWPFLVDNERGKNITVNIAGKSIPLSYSEADGHFYGEVKLTCEMSQKDAVNRWLQFETVMPQGDPRQFVGEVQLIPTAGLSVISDIDDTIKLTDVLNKEALLENTFLRDFQAIPGMSAHYRHWAKQGAAFHYVTGSPWQLYPSLQSFLVDEGFPKGSFTMRHFRLKDSSFLDFLSSAEAYKVTTIDELLQRFPARRFILVGDSGEKDPEVYGEIARRFPDQIEAIFIRNVTEETADSPRFQSAFKSVPTKRWKLFAEPTELDSAP